MELPVLSASKGANQNNQNGTNLEKSVSYFGATGNRTRDLHIQFPEFHLTGPARFFFNWCYGESNQGPPYPLPRVLPIGPPRHTVEKFVSQIGSPVFEPGPPKSHSSLLSASTHNYPHYGFVVMSKAMFIGIDNNII